MTAVKHPRIIDPLSISAQVRFECARASCCQEAVIVAEIANSFHANDWLAILCAEGEFLNLSTPLSVPPHYQVSKVLITK